MKKLLFTLAAAATFAAMAGDPNKRDPGDIDLIGFDNFDFTQNVSSNVVGHNDYGTGSFNESQWVSTTGDDDSVVKPHPSGIESVLTNVPAPFVVNDNVNYLALDTNGGELQRYFSTDKTNGTATAVAATGTYIDTLVQFTVTEDEAPTIDETTKLAIWLGVDEGVTNLYVQGAYYDSSDGESLTVNQTKAYKLNKSCEPGTWYRLTVKAYQTIGNASAVTDGINMPAFSISIDGKELATSDAVYSQAGLYYLCPGENVGVGNADDNYLDADTLTAFKAGKLIPSCDLTRAAASIFCVGFKGTGAIDDLVVTEIDPSPTPSAIDFTLTWIAAEVSAVSYVLSADMATTNTLTSGTAAQIPAGTTGTIELIPTFESGYEFDYVDMGGTQLTLTFDVPTESTNATLVAKAAAAYPTYVGSDTTLQGQYNTWKATNGADSLSAYEKQFLLNVAPATTVADDALQIDAITENETAGWDIVVSTTVSGAALSDGSATTYNGYLLVKAANDLTGLESATPVAYPVTAVSGGKVSINVTGGKFMKVVLTTTAPAAE